VTAAKRVLSTGTLGRPLAVQGIWALLKPPSYFAPPTEWRGDPDGGGVVLINLIHDLDILQFLFGPVERVIGATTIQTRGKAHEAEEGAAIVLMFRRGRVGGYLL